MASKAGRKMKSGERYACGKLKAFNRGVSVADTRPTIPFHRNDVLEELRERTSVYIISAGDGVSLKIGVSRDTARRLIDLQVGHERVLRLFWEARFATRAEAFSVEKETHRRLRGTSPHCRGEWYRLDEETASEAVRSVIRDLKMDAFIDQRIEGRNK